MNRYIFLDKDGTLIKDVPYNVNTSLVEFTPFAIDALCIMQRLGYGLIIVSNQPGIAKGYFTLSDITAVFSFIAERLMEYGISIECFYYCPHFYPAAIPEFSADCICRKPNPGMLLQAAMDHHIWMERSWMIGDILDDIEAGRRAGCNTILIDNGNETVWKPGPFRQPDFSVPDLLEATELISAFETMIL